ncbi:CoA transferase subunit A [Neptunomonas qingdaonensis]|uniref:Acetate CoA/acetoacetate CoA-transferase alpha subunit n=1 Tax=Neptunomonas qingdaonensis TaxID=1045558 RepID=A0A1I2NC95_9GAMM|nr:CoA transferase subunit A [Neptunomonas qingdaonensis]SFF98981.1 acetate CoA/acetoacetate CoA-transferase alpha subunit [Neptunomonas qingdaonensis]
MKHPLSVTEAIALIPDGSTIMIGGFMGVGSPLNLIKELVRQGKKSLCVIANDTAQKGMAIGLLIDAHSVNKVIVSHIGTNPETQRQMIAGELEVELSPQGTLAERVRAGGYGLGGVLTPTGVNTLAADGKQLIEVDGQSFLLERPLKADFALIKAQQSDYFGNLRYRLTAQNFNPLMAMAAEHVIVEVEEMLPVGCIPPDDVHTPGVLVDMIVKSEAKA